ncbi:MAG: hypothetical protein M1816_004600 [Peltula sp. TS41687]|nr:MAG: hypothetical protein M1816_004600 [Peltula sp. TS41687]
MLSALAEAHSDHGGKREKRSNPGGNDPGGKTELRTLYYPTDEVLLPYVKPGGNGNRTHALVAKTRDDNLTSRLKPLSQKVYGLPRSEGFQGADCWSIVDETRPEPKKPEDDKEWKKDNSKTAALILNQCDRDQKQHILTSKSAKESWETLKAVHETPNKQRLGVLLRQFYRFELGSRTINESVSYLNGLQANITGISENRAPDDYEKALFLLGGLSKEYELIETLLSNDLKDDENVAFSSIIAKLREEETKRGKGVKGGALSANANNQTRARSPDITARDWGTILTSAPTKRLKGRTPIRQTTTTIKNKGSSREADSGTHLPEAVVEAAAAVAVEKAKKDVSKLMLLKKNLLKTVLTTMTMKIRPGWPTRQRKNEI